MTDNGVLKITGHDLEIGVCCAVTAHILMRPVFFRETKLYHDVWLILALLLMN
jgi:hypothetical protein